MEKDSLINQRKLETESLTKAVYYLNYSLQYADDFRRECHFDAKREAAMWVTKIKSTLNDIYKSLTSEARERFMQEIAANPDPIFMEAIAAKILHLDANQRELLETMIDGMLSGEEIIFTKTEQ